MTTTSDTVAEQTSENHSPEETVQRNHVSRAKWGVFLAIAFASALLGTGLLRMAANAGGQDESVTTAAQGTPTVSRVERDFQPDGSIDELEARRSDALRDAVAFSEELSNLRASRIKQLESELVQLRFAVEGSEKRIEELEAERDEATQNAKQALKKVIEELGS